MKRIFLLGVFGFVFSHLSAQIVPAGLGKTNRNLWLAFAVTQDLDSLEKAGWKSTTYVGWGTQSGAGHHDPLRSSGIFIANQEFFNRFQPHWEYSLALSYRKQYLYAKEAPFEVLDPSYKNEFRLYSRFSYIHQMGRLEITPTLRQEVMKYFTPDFSDFEETWRFRTRFRMKFSYKLDPKGTHKLILYSEQLFLTSQNRTTKKWKSFGYDDSRFSAYYSLSPQSSSLTFNWGYMLNLMGRDPATSGHYFAMDVIWKNPF